MGEADTHILIGTRKGIEMIRIYGGAEMFQDRWPWEVYGGIVRIVQEIVGLEVEKVGGKRANLC